MKSTDLYAFFSDPNLVELTEQIKTTDDLLGVITLSETQHSAVLAWCMNPNEGHAQGDAVIKDFLVASCAASDDSKYDNKKFFSKWTPGKIRTTSFGAAFVTREFGVICKSKKGRLDLVLVDLQNKILITIENKAGAKLDDKQLEKYVIAVKSEIASRKIFADFDLAFVVLDRELAGNSDDDLDALGKRWALLDYSWLQASAKRAQLQLERGNSAAQLLVAYCQKQTEWESPAEKRISELAAELSGTHPLVVQAMRGIHKQSLLNWKHKAFEGLEGELTLFHAQHPQVCEHVLGVRDIATILQQLLRAAPELKMGHTMTGRTWFLAVPPVALDLMHDADDADWPIYINIWRDARASTDVSPKFTLRLFWCRNQFDATRCDESVLRQHFLADYPSLSKNSKGDIRKIVVKQHISLANAHKEANKLLESVSRLIASRPKGRETS